MPKRLPDVKTIVTRQEVLEALWGAWIAYFNAVPKKESIWVLMSQWALESGWGNFCHCYNLGNVKSRPGDGRNYCFFECDEVLGRKSAERYRAKDPGLVKIKSYQGNMAVVQFYPDHPVARFRAFESLHGGAADYLALLAKRFHMSWPAVAAGDPAQFAHLLKLQGYYTASESRYTKTLTGVFEMIAKDGKLDYESLPIMTRGERQAVLDRLVFSV